MQRHQPARKPPSQPRGPSLEVARGSVWPELWGRGLRELEGDGEASLSPDLVGPPPEGPWRVSTQAAPLPTDRRPPRTEHQERGLTGRLGSTSFLAAVRPLTWGAVSSPSRRDSPGRALLPRGRGWLSLPQGSPCFSLPWDQGSVDCASPGTNILLNPVLFGG